MGTFRKLKLLQALMLVAVGLVVANCSKSDGGSSSDNVAATSTGLYLTCSSNGYYTYNNASYACTPNTQVYIAGAVAGCTLVCPTTGSYIFNGVTVSCSPGATTVIQQTSTGGYITCPANGIYSYNGMTCSCSAGQTVLQGTGCSGTGSNVSNQCTAYYGPGYYPYVVGNRMYCQAGSDPCAIYGSNAILTYSHGRASCVFYN